MTTIVYYCRNLHPLTIVYDRTWTIVNWTGGCNCGGRAVRYPTLAFYHKTRTLPTIKRHRDVYLNLDE